ncbi:TPA: hypothetical protein EYP37_01460 [Candidatus Poribacteria bacterium]|nr:hypothetical protein [Candidatus Poribacteria bacterium]
MRLSMTGNERRLITIALLSIEVLFIYLLILKPKLIALRSAKISLNSQIKLYEVKREKASLLPQVEKEYLSARGEYLSIKRRFFTAPELENFVKTFSSLVRASGAYLVSIQPYQRIESRRRGIKKEKIPKNLARQKLQIIIRGGYDKLLDLVSQIESDPKAIIIDQMNIVRAPNSKKHVELTMIVSLYWIKQEVVGKR